MHLSPCPFCLGSAEYVPAYGVRCQQCSAQLPCTADQAQARWNIRPSPVTVEEMEWAVENWPKD